MSLIESPRRVERVRHDIHRRDVHVSETRRISDHVIAITFAGDSLRSFVSPGFDDHVKLILPGPDGESIRRDYTPRHFDTRAGTLTLEFSLHDGGTAADWAHGARPGDTAVIAGPRSSLLIDTSFDWHLLAGDISALPAIHRRLETLPQDARVLAFIEVPGPGDRREFTAPAATSVRWLNSGDALVSAIWEATLPAGDGFAWCAGEAATMAQLRRILVDGKRIPASRARIAAYWRAGTRAHHQVLAA